MERAIVTGIMRNLLRALCKRNRAVHLTQRTKRAGSHIPLRVNGHRILRANKDEARRARRILETYGQQDNGQRFVTVDVARWVADMGSLGPERHSMLARPENDPATLRPIDVRLPIPSVWADMLGSACNVAP